MILYQNQNYTVELDRNSEYQYKIINRVTEVEEYASNMLPEVLSVALALDIRLNKFYTEEMMDSVGQKAN